MGIRQDTETGSVSSTGNAVRAKCARNQSEVQIGGRRTLQFFTNYWNSGSPLFSKTRLVRKVGAHQKTKGQRMIL